jgi:hypothetical protein
MKIESNSVIYETAGHKLEKRASLVPNKVKRNAIILSAVVCPCGKKAEAPPQDLFRAVSMSREYEISARTATVERLVMQFAECRSELFRRLNETKVCQLSV